MELGFGFRSWWNRRSLDVSLCLVVKEKKRNCDFKVVIFWAVFEFFVFWDIHLVCSWTIFFLKFFFFRFFTSVFFFLFLFIKMLMWFIYLFNFWVCVLVVLVQDTLRSQFTWFLVFKSVFIFFYLVKINKLIFLI